MANPRTKVTMESKDEKAPNITAESESDVASTAGTGGAAGGTSGSVAVGGAGVAGGQAVADIDSPENIRKDLTEQIARMEKEFLGLSLESARRSRDHFDAMMTDNRAHIQNVRSEQLRLINGGVTTSLAVSTIMYGDAVEDVANSILKAGVQRAKEMAGA